MEYLKQQVVFLQDKTCIKLTDNQKKEETYVEIVEWIRSNSEGSVYSMADCLWFQNKEDASAFILRWRENA